MTGTLGFAKPGTSSPDRSIAYIGESLDPWSFYREQLVQVNLPDLRMVGVYRGLSTQQQLVLDPHIATKDTLAGTPQSRKPVLYWVKKPLFMPYDKVFAVSNRDEVEMNSLVSESQLEEQCDPACLI